MEKVIMKKYTQELFVGERALYHSCGLEIYDSVFADGESPLKESRDITLHGSIFKWKYPLWYCKDIIAEGCVLLDSARSGIWYTDGISMTDCVIEAPKTFRRASNITLRGCSMPNAKETLWSCDGIRLADVTAVGDYFAMNSRNIYIENFTLDGNYGFDGAENVELHNARLISKDAFWNCKNVVVYDSLIVGEYLGWNSENVTFINCTVESNQGLCYMSGLKMVNCKLVNTDLAFELSTVDAEIASKIDSVKNPLSGVIRAREIGELIFDFDMTDPKMTKIITEKVTADSDEV